MTIKHFRNRSSHCESEPNFIKKEIYGYCHLQREPGDKYWISYTWAQHCGMDKGMDSI